ncbi:MAG: hypothetical protein ACK4OM_02690 [Alphaproteobacteria bacterium]
MKNILLILMILNITACVSNEKIHTSIIEPESLLDFSHEKISFALKTNQSLNEIEDIIKKDIPSNAEFVCNHNNKICREAKDLFNTNNIEYKEIYDANIEPYVALNYDRIIAKDCSSLGKNDKSSSIMLGCSNSSNILQMISDYKQVTNPNIMDPVDAASGVKNYNKYQTHKHKR